MVSPNSLDVGEELAADVGANVLVMKRDGVGSGFDAMVTTVFACTVLDETT
jgi:hypothetical protein